MKRIKKYLPLSLLIVALLALRWTVVEPYVVPTGSMEPTLKPGDRLYALKCAYDIRFPFTDWVLMKTGTIKRGNVILFRAPRTPSITYVKRVMGVPGDTVEFRHGVLFVNDKEVEKAPASDTSIMSDLERPNYRTLYIETLGGTPHYMVLDDIRRNLRETPRERIPPGYLFVSGDNRDNSSDSREWGLVPIKNVKGEAMFIWYSSHHVNGAPWWYNLKLLLREPRSERVGTLIQ